MIYLIVQTFILLLIAGLLGLIFGWYLTRISAADAHTALQLRLRDAEKDARELRTELDAMATAKSNCDSERRLLSDELADLRARQDAAQGDAGHARALAGAVEQSEQEVDSVAIASAAASGAQGLMAAQAAPAKSNAEEGADDLRQIKGIGPKIAGILEELGIRRFDQIAAWTPENIVWVNAHLKFKGRVEREEWISQARALIAAREA